MNEKALRVLEYPKIIQKLTDYAGSQPGKELCRNLSPSSDLTQIRRMQRETSDAVSRLLRKGNVSFSGLADIRMSLRRLEVGSSLNVEELLRVAKLLETTSRVKAWSRSAQASLEEQNEDSLEEMFTSLQPLTSLSHEINRCIPSEEEIADDASPGLKQVRRQMHQANDRIRAQLNAMVNGGTRNYLQDAVITQRNGRFCIPVKAEYRSQVPGMIHDQSSTGSTLFIEPMAVVKLNNDLRELEIKEEKEIEIVLANLSGQVAVNSDAINDNILLMTELDFIFARAQLSLYYKGSEPDFNEEGRVRIKKGRHPLLDPKKVVPVDIRIGEDFTMLVISGPNTGGKTVSLKTVGLFTLLGQSGLHIPASDHSELAIFDEIYADIGDEQSIEQSLSTFSAHMTNIVSFWDQADERSLVLFDELGAGTDPTEGAALAISILSNLHRRNVRTIATTHYSELKVFALSTPGIENGCCEFSVETLRPTYRLLIGVPGKSNAFAISEKLGLPDYVIEEAREHLTQDAESFEDLRAEGVQLTFRVVVEAERALLFVVDAEEPFGLGFGRAVMLCDDDQQAIVPEHTEAHEVAGAGHADWFAVFVVETPFGAAVRFVAPCVVPCGFEVGDRRCVVVAQVHERGGYAVPLGSLAVLAGAEQSSERVVAAELVLVAAVGVDIDGRQFLGRDRADVVADSSVIAHNP